MEIPVDRSGTREQSNKQKERNRENQNQNIQIFTWETLTGEKPTAARIAKNPLISDSLNIQFYREIHINVQITNKPTESPKPRLIWAVHQMGN